MNEVRELLYVGAMLWLALMMTLIVAATVVAPFYFAWEWWQGRRESRNRGRAKPT